MGFYVTLLYLTLTILSPATVLPELAPYRIQWWVAGLALLGTASMLPIHGYPIRSLQTLLMLGFFCSVVLSRVMRGWLGGAVNAVAEFGTFAIVFFLLVGTTHSLSRLRQLAVVLSLPTFYAIFRGYMAVEYNWEYPTYVLDQNVWDTYQTNIAVVPRIRFVGWLADPNDLAQYFLVVMPFVALLWRPRNPIRNLVVVIPLLGLLFYGMYLTHSRGVLIGLVVLTMVYLGGRFNKTVMTVGSATIGVLLVAANFAGGRAIGMSSGSDRIEAWGAGLSMLRDRPILGVGYNLFTDVHEITAHNSFVLCFSELGLVGFFCWLALIVSTLLGLNQFIRIYSPQPAYLQLVRWAVAIRASLASFAVTAWFLSRTYAPLLYVLLAMWVVVEQMALRMQQQGRLPAPVPGQPAGAAALPAPGVFRPAAALPWASRTVLVQVTCIFVVYVMVRMRWAN